MSLHEFMFLPTLKGQADEEQAKVWVPLAENYKIIGCCKLLFYLFIYLYIYIYIFIFIYIYFILL